jgi:DNA-directed RNA polymerase subunit L
MKALEDDDNVALVRYLDEHPELIDRKLYVEVKEGDPIAALEKASDFLIQYFKS